MKPSIPSIRFDISEKDVEDVLFYGMDDFLGLKPIKRQFSTPVGIIDVIAKLENVYFVIEIKKDILNASSVCQVLRYCRYMNGQYSKGGDRVFLPLLIGKNLHEELFHLVEYLEDHDDLSNRDYGRIFYRLYNINPMSGFSFSYFNKIQQDYECFHETPMSLLHEEHSNLDCYAFWLRNENNRLESDCLRREIVRLESDVDCEND